MWSLKIIIYEIFINRDGGVTKTFRTCVEHHEDVVKWLNSNGNKDRAYCSELVHVNGELKLEV